MTPVNDVSVVVTTIGREELRRAVLSAGSQTYPPIEIIVVCDAARANPADMLRDVCQSIDVPVRHLRSDGRGGNAARNSGIDAAQAQLVALLDDDDWWFPDKLQIQVEEFNRLSPRRQSASIVASRFLDERTGRVEPVDTYSAGPLVEWLFDVSLKHPSRLRTIQTSGLLLPSDLARAVRFDEGVMAHQDWDFLLRAVAAGATLLHLGRPLYVLAAGAPQKISANSHLLNEQRWAEGALGQRSKQLSYYYLAIAAPRALQRSDGAAAWHAVRCGLRRRVSFKSAFLFAAFLSVRSMNWLMKQISRNDTGTGKK